MSPSLYRPDSIMWRVDREWVITLGSGAALLMQFAHPGVAAGVADHSHFSADPWRRIVRTYNLMTTLVFGDREQVEATVRHINRLHETVKGEGYAASDPALLFWVQATLIYTALKLYEAYVGPLSPAEREAYYRDTHLTGSLLGIPSSLYPERLQGLYDYMDRALSEGPAQVGSTARELATQVFQTRIPLVHPIVHRPLNLLTTWLLPESLRRAYGLAWGKAEQRQFGLLDHALRFVVRHAPLSLRTMPPARAALRRYRQVQPAYHG